MLRKEKYLGDFRWFFRRFKLGGHEGKCLRLTGIYYFPHETKETGNFMQFFIRFSMNAILMTSCIIGNLASN